MKPEDVTPELLTWLKESAEKSAEFMQREAPLIANEIVAWHFWSSIYGAIMFALAAVIAAVVARLVYPSAKRNMDEHDNPFPIFAFAILVVVSPLCFFIGTGANAYEAIKANVAPRVVIIQYIRGAVK